MFSFEFIHQDFSGINQQGSEHTGASKQANACVNNTVPRLNKKETIQTNKTGQKKQYVAKHC